MDRKTNSIGYLPVIIITAIITAIIMYIILCRIMKPDPPIVDKPNEIISIKDAVELHLSYRKNRSCIIKAYEGQDSTITTLCSTRRTPNPNFVPSLAFDLDKKFLEQYMLYINQITADSIDITGYRLYLGNYPDSTYFADGRIVKDPRRNTFFIAPTTLIENETRGYTFVDRNNDGQQEILFLEDEFDFRTSTPGQNPPKTKINTASFFSFSSQGGGDQSTVANEIGGHPPQIQ
ncbi:hypothetical protein [Aquimarina algiphila]|uniref:hypothetical protein n=1 Tax=Aquimarina algiphila TaxID=2047982 RepID=UPI002330473D|nr:hypothetical protein [Aquimarina algiphila]